MKKEVVDHVTWLYDNLSAVYARHYTDMHTGLHAAASPNHASSWIVSQTWYSGEEEDEFNEGAGSVAFVGTLTSSKHDPIRVGLRRVVSTVKKVELLNTPQFLASPDREFMLRTIQRIRTAQIAGVYGVTSLQERILDHLRRVLVQEGVIDSEQAASVVQHLVGGRYHRAAFGHGSPLEPEYVALVRQDEGESISVRSDVFQTLMRMPNARKRAVKIAAKALSWNRPNRIWGQ